MGKRLMRVITISAVILITLISGSIIWGNLSLENKIMFIIIKDRPQLLVCRDDEEKLDIVRDWVYENTIMACGVECYSDGGAEQYLSDLVRKNPIEYGYYCGGIADVLSYIYVCMGYEACILDMAVSQEDNVLASHVVTLVYVEGKWIVEDATFNVTYTDIMGEHIDICTLRENLGLGADICVKHGRTMFRPCIYSSLDYMEKYISAGLYDVEENIVFEKNGRYFGMTNVNITRYIEQGLSESVLTIFTEDGYKVNEAVLYMYPCGIWTPSNAKNSVIERCLELRQILEIL